MVHESTFDARAHLVYVMQGQEMHLYPVMMAVGAGGFHFAEQPQPGTVEVC